ncbi:PepSY domain-containing protein [Planctobacterium marinum]|uniref:PepSY domain-containing protein n=1 Tax=Planctobacterium marinum TaxID=1631968 RepID=A0AA48HU72_9ALTE|nr:hypothetical protein MACH26_14590 [Planctobacterium marinum]
MQFLKFFLLITMLVTGLPALANEGATSKAEAAKLAQRQVTGRVLKVEAQGNKYRVKILQSSGRVIFIEIQRKTAQHKERGE